jgi:hypothetical protein
LNWKLFSNFCWKRDNDPDFASGIVRKNSIKINHKKRTSYVFIGSVYFHSTHLQVDIDPILTSNRFAVLVRVLSVQIH